MKRIILLAVLLFVLPTIGHGQGAVSIDQVNTLVSDYAIRPGEPARFVFRFNNSTGQKCNVSNGFKISSPDGAVWDSVTIDSAGLTTSGENRFAGFFDIAFALWGGVTMGGDGSNPDTVGVLGAGNPSRATRMMPAGYNDTAIAVIVWMHNATSAGKQICIDTAFWGSGGTWVWVGSNLVDFFPTLSGLPGQPYSNGSGVNRDGSGFCFEINDVIPPVLDTVHVPSDYATIQGAVNAVNPDGVVLVDPGTYTESITITGKKVDVKSTNGALTTIITNSDGTDLVIFLGPETNGSVIEGFTLQGGRIGIWCQQAAPIIRRNLLRSQHATSWAAIALSGIGWGTIGQSPAQIINNTIFGNTGGGISTFSTIAPTIKNTIIANNVKYGIHVQDDMNPQIALSYNDVYGNPVAYYNVPNPGTGTITSDPLFAGDFTLQEFSPCINAGDPAPMYNDPDGSRNDMGAFPFDGSVEPPTGDTLRVPQQYPTIQAAIDAAQNGQVVLVGRGYYTGGINFNGKLIKVTSVDGPLGTSIVPLIEPDSSLSTTDLVTFNHGENSQAVLEGFTLEAGRIGVLILGAGPTIRHNIFLRQKVTNWAAISIAGSYTNGVASEGPAPAIIENNTIMGCANGGISTFSTIAPVIRNNIIYNNAAYGIHKQSVALPIALSYNDIYGNPHGNYNISDFGPGAISLDPQLDMFGALTATSPCINAGDPNPIFNDPDGSRNDMGALPFGGSGPSGLMNLVQWRAADGGNDHWYAVIPEKLYWIQADAKAKTFAKDGIPGHLATIGSPFENQFIVDHVLMGANQNNRFDNFFIGGRDTGGQWQWITGEPWGYTNWASGEPNNVGIETALCMYGHYDTYSQAIPGTWNNALPDGTVNQLHQYWSVIEFGVGDTVVVDEPIPTNEWISLFCAAPNLDGVPLSPGAVIRAFDPQGVLCGKASVKSDGSIGFLLVYRDDPYTSRDEGAVPGDKISFRINNEVATVSPAVYWTQNGDQFQTCAFERNACITLQLQQGWNLISWNVGWGGAPRDLLTPVINCVEFVLGFDHGGLVYDPQLERFSTLSQVDFLHGYWVKMSCAADLEVCGDQLPVSTVIPVDPGWNLVSYLPMTTMSPSAGFLTINANLQVAIGYENGARIYVPTNPSFNTLTILEPGAGYWLRMSAADVLEYGFMPVDGTDPHTPASLTTSSGDEFGSRVWMSLYGDEISVDGLPLADNSSIEVYSPSGQLIGRGTYADRLLKFMPVYGYDGDEGSARLARSNDQLTLKVNGQEIAERIIWTGEGTSYRLGALTTAGLPSNYSLAQNYPNPFNPATTIAFAVPNHQHVRIVVFNLLGQEIRTLADDEYDAGQYKVVWDGRDRGGDLVPTGLYFYRMESGDVNLTRKMMLLK